MNFIKKCLPLTLIILFSSALFYAIYMHIDGLGILSIALGIMYFAHLVYATTKKVSVAKDKAQDLPLNNITKMFEIFTSRLFLQLVVLAGHTILSVVEKHKSKSSQAKAEKLEDDLQSMIDKLKASTK